MGIDHIARRIRTAIINHPEIFVIPKEKGSCKYDDMIIIPAEVKNYKIKCRLEIMVNRDMIKDKKYEIDIKFQTIKDDMPILYDMLNPIIRNISQFSNIDGLFEIKICSDDEIFESFIDLLARFYNVSDNISKSSKIDKSKMKKDEEKIEEYGYKYSEELKGSIFSRSFEKREEGIIQKCEESIDINRRKCNLGPKRDDIYYQDSTNKVINISIRGQKSNTLSRSGVTDATFKLIDNMSDKKSIIEAQHKKFTFDNSEQSSDPKRLYAHSTIPQLQGPDKQLFQCFNCLNLNKKGTPYCQYCKTKFNW